LVVTERRFPYRVLADLQRGMDDFLATLTVRHFSGVRQYRGAEELHFTELLVRNRESPAVCVPPQYEEIDIGEDEPVRCLKTGLWLLEDNGSRFAVFLEPAPQYSRYSGIRFQVA